LLHTTDAKSLEEKQTGHRE